MEKTLAIALCAAVGAAASAGPIGPAGTATQVQRQPAPGPGTNAVDNEMLEDFDCYAPGALITAQPGWEFWPGGTVSAPVVTTYAASGANSMHLAQTGADIVHQFEYTEGQLIFSCMTYMESSATDVQAYVIALNSWDGSGATPGTLWSMQVKFDSFLGELESQFRSFFTPMIYDRWVELRAEIDLDADLWDLYYDGVLWAEDQSWTDGSFSGGIGVTEFQAIDLYLDFSDGAGFYLDDVMVTPVSCMPASTCGGAPSGCAGGCYPDCDGSGTLDFFDFLCFQNAFAAGDPYADCDTSGALDFFDFLCFQNEFAAGCP